MRKSYVCPQCKGFHWKISFDTNAVLHIMHCSNCGFNRSIIFETASIGLDKFPLDTIEMGFENTGIMTDQEKCKNG